MISLSQGSTLSDAPALIELKIDSVHQLFHALDPSPFTEKDLDTEAEEFIVGWAMEQRTQKPLELLIHQSEPGRLAWKVA